MKPKLNEQKQMAMSAEGLPIFINESGEEVVVDAARLFKKISDLNAENKQHREEKELLAAENRVLKEPKKTKEKTEVEDLDALRRQLAEMKASAEAERTQLVKQLNEQSIKNEFGKSSLFSGADAKTVLKPEIAFKLFGDRFQVKDGRVIATEKTGSEMYSRKDVTELASFEEAVDVIMSEMGVKNDITRAFSGSGAVGGKAATPTQVNQLAVEQAKLNGQYDKLIDDKLRADIHANRSI